MTARVPVMGGVLPEVDAKALDLRIRDAANVVQADWQLLGDLVNDAKAGQIHVALGYDTWTTYLADAVQKPLRALGDRPAVVTMLSDQGLSNGAVAEVVGISKDTVRRDRALVSQDATVGPTAPAPSTKTGINGKTYQDQRPADLPKPRRTAFQWDIGMCTHDIRAATTSMEKAVRRIELLQDDDRYSKYRTEAEEAIRSAYASLGRNIDHHFPRDVVDADVVEEDAE